MRRAGTRWGPRESKRLPLARRRRQVLLRCSPQAVLIGHIGVGLIAGRLDLGRALVAHVGGGVDRRRTKSERAGTDGDRKERAACDPPSTVPTSNAGDVARCLPRPWQKGGCHVTATQRLPPARVLAPQRERGVAALIAEPSELHASEYGFRDDTQRVDRHAAQQHRSDPCVLPAAFQACSRSLMRSGCRPATPRRPANRAPRRSPRRAGRQKGVLDLRRGFLVAQRSRSRCRSSWSRAPMPPM